MPLATWAGGVSSGPDLPLDRPYTMQNLRRALLEGEHDRMILDSLPLRFAFPRPCEPVACPLEGGLAFRDTAAAEALTAQPLVSETYRYQDGDGGTWSTEAGVILSGAKGPASFRIDARMYDEVGGTARVAYDREDFDRQTDSVSGAGDFDSYVRYRGDLDYDSPVGRFTVARDAAHWGPGLLLNLVFHQDAVPFDQVRYAARIGPLSVTSLYGDLVIGGTQGFSEENLGGRNLYAHRYELALGDDWTAGVSEQLILHGQSKPILFAPIIPLFIAKGTMHEGSNNGNLAADLAWRWRGVGLFYAEFLLDDLESPSSLLLEDYVQNKWAFMCGFHAARRLAGGTAGFIGEFSRIEPYVYTHFVPNTSQAANLGYPLGNPLGPNSMAVAAKAYFRAARHWYGGARVDLFWKGTGPGSGLNDPNEGDPLRPKHFLSGADATVSTSPELSYDSGRYGVDAACRIGDDFAMRIATRITY